MVLRDVIEVVVGLLVGCGGAFVAIGLLMAIIVGAEELSGRLRQRLSGDRSLRLEQYRAEQALHGIRRQGVLDLLAAERQHRMAAEDGVIEGFAVEVRE